MNMVFLLFESLPRDARFVLRQLRRSPGVAIAALLTLALGIGANAAIFSLVEGILLRPMPYRHPERLVVIWQATPEHRATGAYFNTYRQFEAFRQNSRSFERLSAMSWASGLRSGAVQWNGKPVEMLAFPASIEFFSTLGVSAEIGRTFAPADLSAACTVVLTHGFWQNKLGAPANIASQTFDFGDVNCRVVGVMPRSFSFYPPQTDAWMLITPSSTFVTKPWESMTGIFGRLNPGVTREAAEAELASIETRILPEVPQDDAVMRNWSPDVIPLHDNFTWLTGRNLRRGLWLLLGASSLILLMACANLGSLLHGRAMDRSRELAIRSALGAGRGRLIGQLLTESLLLATSGTGAGLVLAAGLLRWFRAANPIQLPPGTAIVVDWHVFIFAAAAGTLCLFLFGLLPARHASRIDINAALRAGGAAQGTSRSGLRSMQGLVVVQVALSMIMVATATLLAKSLWNLVTTNVGYRTEHLFTSEIDFPRDRYTHQGDLSRLAAQLVPHLAALPGVESVTFASRYLPMGGSTTLQLEGHDATEKNAPTAVEQDVTPDYFATLAIPLLRGRDFDTHDQAKTQPVAIINEALAKRWFAGVDPIGHAIQLGSDRNASPWLTIVGITGDVKTTTVFQEMGYVENPVVYRLLAQTAPASLALLAATHGPVRDLASVVQQRLSAQDRDLVLTDLDGLRALRDGDLSQPRFRTVVFEGFAALALALALVGLYGVLAQMVLRQRRDIGIRMALGADRAHILRAVLGQAGLLTVAGIAAGALGAVGAGRLLGGLLYGIHAQGALEFTGAAVAMLAVAAITAWLPARRAASADPVSVLRAE